ncbi:MAG: hypothetical protein ACQGVK_05325 [Myxococcota bacterium]
MTESPETLEASALEWLARFPGRIVRIRPDGAAYLGRGYDLYRSDDDGAEWRRVASLPRSPWRRAAEWTRLGTRLLRQELRAVACVGESGLVVSNRQGVFHGSEGDGLLRPSVIDCGSGPLRPPMRLTARPDGTVVWGEYGAVRSDRPMRLFASRDRGRTHRVVHTFGNGEIGHVHNVIWDEGEGHYWVLAGDHADHAGIGRLSDDLQRFEWYVRGQQRFRAVEVFDLGDRLLYATDSEMETNALVVLDKRGGRSERLREFDGSCIYACRFGGLMALTTSVEPSEVNHGTLASLWLSRDGDHWDRAYASEKDGYSAHYFQFGSLVLPSGRSPRETVMFSGQAVHEMDGRTAVVRYTGPTSEGR